MRISKEVVEKITNHKPFLSYIQKNVFHENSTISGTAMTILTIIMKYNSNKK